MSIALLDIAISLVGVDAAVSALQNISATATNTYASLEMMQQSYAALASQELLASGHARDMADARKQGAKYAEELFTWSTQLAQISPFGTQDIAHAVKLAQAYNFLATDLTSVYEAQEQGAITAQRVVSAMANVIAGTGGAAFQIAELVQILGQVKGIGKLQAEEWYQFAERSIPIGQILSEAFDMPTNAIIRMREEGQLTYDMVMPAILQWAERYYGTAMQDMGNTWTGLTSGLSDAFHLWMATIAQDPIEKLKPEIEILINFLNSAEFQVTGAKIGEAIAESLSHAIKAIDEIKRQLDDPFVKAFLQWSGRGIQNETTLMFDMIGDAAKGREVLQEIVPQDYFGEFFSNVGTVFTALPSMIFNPNLNKAEDVIKGFQGFVSLFGVDTGYIFPQIGNAAKIVNDRRAAAQAVQTAQAVHASSHTGITIPTDEPSSAFTTSQEEITELAQKQAEALLSLRETTNEKLREQQRAYLKAEKESYYQHTFTLREMEYQHQRLVNESWRKYNQSKEERERQWRHQQAETLRKHYNDLAAVTRDRLLELQDIARDLRPATQRSLDTLATTEADFQRDAEQRLENWNKKRRLLAQQGAMCKLPEEHKAFEEQEQQAAKAYQKQEQQQREALGRQLIDYAVAMALRNDIGAAAIQQMVAGIAAATGAYDSATAGLLGNTFASIDQWARSGGAGTAAVLANVRALPEAARAAKVQEQQLAQTLREQAIAMFQHTGNVMEYQRALNAIPQQVAVQMGLTDEVLPQSTVWKGQEKWLQKQAEAERDFRLQQLEAERAHKYDMSELELAHFYELDELDYQHNQSLLEADREFQKERTEAWRKFDQTVHEMQGEAHQRELEDAMRHGDRMVAEALAQAGNLTAAERATLTGDYQAALDYELKMQNWLTRKLNAIDYSNLKQAQQERSELYSEYGTLRSEYTKEQFAPIPQNYQTTSEMRDARAPHYYRGQPLNLTINLEAGGIILQSVKKTVEMIDGQLEEAEITGRQMRRK